MAKFKRRNWKNRIVEYANRFRCTDVDTGSVTRINLNRDPGKVTEKGDAVSAEDLNDLEDRIETALDQNEDEYTEHLTTIKGYSDAAGKSANAAADSANRASTSASAAASSESVAKSSADVAQQESKAAGTSMDRAAESANAAKSSETAAKLSADAAATSEKAVEDAIVTNGYAHLYINEAGHLMLYRTTQAALCLDFSIKDHKNLEVSLA